MFSRVLWRIQVSLSTLSYSWSKQQPSTGAFIRRLSPVVQEGVRAWHGYSSKTCKSFYVTRRAGFWGALTGVVHLECERERALEGVSFLIQPGELVGYIGPNEAAKSTTIKVHSGILVPDCGRCEVGGLAPWKRLVEHVGRIGVVFGQRSQLWWDLPLAGVAFFLLALRVWQFGVRCYQSTGS